MTFQKYSPSSARSGPMPPPLTLTTLALSPTGAIAFDTPVNADRTKGTFSTFTSLFIATTPCCGVAWLSSNWMMSFFDSILSALACSTARLAAAPNNSPYSALGPLMGRSAPILMLSWALAAPQCMAASKARKRRWRMRFPQWRFLQVLFERLVDGGDESIPVPGWQRRACPTQLASGMPESDWRWRNFCDRRPCDAGGSGRMPQPPLLRALGEGTRRPVAAIAAGRVRLAGVA